jgi:hypothetical protein
MVSLSWVTYPFWRKVVYFHGRPAHTLTLVYFHGRPAHTHLYWSIFTGDLPTHTHCGLFLGATNPHTITLVYFHRRPAHTYSHWSIFRGDLPMHTHTGLFLRATYPFDWVNLRSHLAIFFNQNQNRGIARSTWNSIWRFLLTKAKLYVWLGYPEIPSGDLL